MKIASLMIGFLVTLSVNAYAEPAAINLEGRVSKSTGLESGREGQPCSLTLQPHDENKSGSFYFGIGEKSDLYGTRKSNTKRVGSDYVYMGPKEEIGNHLIRQEEVIVDISHNGSEGKLIRRMLQYDPANVFTFTQLSEIKCKLIDQGAITEQEAQSATAEEVPSDELLK